MKDSAFQQQISQNPPGDILTIMHRQNEITAALVQQQQSSSLPPRDILLFEGDPLRYRAFIRAFEQGGKGRRSWLFVLFGAVYKRTTSRAHAQLPTYGIWHGYAVAKHLIQKHFGNPYKIATACMEKALAWQTIKSEDVKALQAYSLFLRGCCNIILSTSRNWTCL